MTTLRMPDLGTVEGTVTLVRWLKREGETVALGEPLFEVETDKGVSEVEAAAGGTLVSRLVAEGASVAAGEPIAEIQGAADRTTSGPAARAAVPPAAAAPGAARIVEPAPLLRSVSPVRGPGPVLIALARKHGVDISSVSGSGPAGAVTREDILNARRGSGPSGVGLGALQSVVAARVSQSHREKPVYHVTMRVDMTRVISAREADPARPGFTAFLVKACATTLSEMPAFRRWMSGQQVRTHELINLAVAVGVDDDLFAPVVQGADGMDVRAIDTAIKNVAAQARAGTVERAESCFLVSNLGAYPVESFDAIILPEHAAALAVGASVPAPVVVDGAVVIAPIAGMTLSVDHRLVNGGTAARFLARVKELLERGME
ncbi:MAG TPA: dihydrolipoamide acetyltransferase family protein [bacterium]|nr:dihydrolipoamide acetyltransferase family protein [bacterium]